MLNINVGLLADGHHDIAAAPCSRTSILRVSTVTFFANCSQTPRIDLKFEYTLGKPMKRRFQQCIVHTEILSTFHARVEFISVTKYAIETIGPMGANDPKIHLPLRHVDPI